MIRLIKTTVMRAFHHDGLRKYGANTIWLFTEKFFRMAIGFTIGIYVARQLGPAKYGVLNYALSYVGIFSAIAGLGLDSIVVRELVKTPEKQQELLGSTFILKLAGFLLMLVGIVVGLFFSNNSSSTNIIVAVIAGGYLFQTLQTIDFYYQAEVKSKYVAISQITALLIVSAFRFYFAYKLYPLIYFAGLEAMYMVISFLLYTVFYIIIGNNPFKWRFSTTTARMLLKNSWPLLLSGAAIMINMRIDQVMIKSMLKDNDVGCYAVVVRLVEIWYFIPTIVCSSLFPAIILSKKISLQHYKARLIKLFSLMFWTAITICIIMLFVYKYIILFLYGSKYADSIPALYIYVWAMPFVFWGVARSKWLITENFQKYSLYCSVAAMLVNIVINYILIPRIGINGAAIATVFAQFFSVVVIPFLIKETRISCVMFYESINPFFIIKKTKR